MREPVRTQELIERAVEATGLEDFGAPPWRDGLEVLVSSAGAEGGLNDMGWSILRSWVHERLTNRLRAVDWATRHPELTRTPVEAPLVVAGMLRTGTTILCELLASDPANRPLYKWEALDSVPPPRGGDLATDARVARTVEHVEQTYAMVPRLRAVHYEPGDGPTECVALLGQGFRSQDWLGLFHLPSYLEWYLADDLSPAYDYERLALQVLQSDAPGRWSLKAPGHLLALDALFATFPDTRLIITHRDPVCTVPSSISLSLTSRPDSLTQADLTGWFESMWFRMLATMTDRLCDWRDAHPEITVADVPFDRFVRDPIAEVERIYATFGLTLSIAARSAMSAHLAASPSGRHGRHRYSLADAGLTEHEVRDRFARYTEQFDVHPARIAQPETS